ncbi:pyrroloquinoline quinone biosynthesis protein PqqE [Novosphingobium nitrogenifigens]|nr:pyrroloquinoline quinone biosynthesis protein PqqE [Novosphingobium nitrogenifigens]
MPPPMGLIAEITHRCPLQCAYCANPLELVRPTEELDTSGWKRVIEQAAELGVLQFHFTGGEPLARRDLVELVAHAAANGLYTNLITSGVLLTPDLMAALVTAGIDHIQLSFQEADPQASDRFGGYNGGHAKKIAAAAMIRESGLSLTTNFVVHRQNIDSLPAMLALGEELGSERIEIAHTQYYGWALRNRDALLPTREQLEAANAIVDEARAGLAGRIAIDYVVPDYYAARPKACMGGWGQRFLHILPSGKVLPCHAAETIPSMTFASVRDQSLAAIWEHDPAFARFRGTAWMPDPCRSCDRREIDWGGCRCQALALAGDAARVDPVCARSPEHDLVEAIIATRDRDVTSGDLPPLVPRRYQS